MKIAFVLPFVGLLAISCKQPFESKNESQISSFHQDTASNKNSTAVPIAQENQTDDDSWLNDLVGDYMLHSKNEVIEMNVRKDPSGEVWMDEGMAERDGVRYYMCHIGHHFAEEDGSEPRFVTDGWAYVDSAKRILYEYDVANDSLITWKR